MHKIVNLSMISLLLLTAQWPAFGQRLEPGYLQVEAKIPLGNVKGRIDHLAIDLPRQRLFVAELGNDSLGVIDVKERKLLHRIGGLREPQGAGYVRSTDTLYVSNASDGSVRLFKASDFSPAGRINVGDDADNIRVASATDRVLVGYGSGALAVIDPASHSRIADIALKAHPESFQIDNSTGLIFVNVPRAHEIAVVDQSAGKQKAAWPTHNDGNFPMAIDQAASGSLWSFVALRCWVSSQKRMAAASRKWNHAATPTICFSIPNDT